MHGFPLRRSLVVILLTASALAACKRREPPLTRPDPESPRLYTVAEQRRIQHACRYLWSGVDLKQPWDEIATRIFDVCGGDLRVDEAFLLAGCHPRTLLATAWRGEFEASLLRRSRWSWNPSPEPRCKLIRDTITSSSSDPSEEKGR